MVSEIRFKFTRYLHKLYWELYEEGEVSEEAIGILSSTCEVVNDDNEIKFNMFELLSRNFTMNEIKYYIKLKDVPIIGLYMTRQIVQKLYLNYEIATAFLECCEDTTHLFTETFPVKDKENLRYVLEEVKE